MDENNEPQEEPHKTAQDEADEQKRVADTHKKAEAAELKAAKDAEEASKQRAKTATREAVMKFGVGKIAAILVALVAVACVGVFVVKPSMESANTASTILTETELEKTVSVSKLATSKCVYRGVAEKRDDEGNTAYHVYYESSVEASINMEDINFVVDEEAKTVTPMLPEPTIERPVVDTNSIEFFERDASGDMKDAITLCKQDALDKVTNNTAIKDRAAQNLKSTVEALTKPILEREGYRLTWELPKTEEASDAEE